MTTALAFEDVSYVAGGRRLLDRISFALADGERLAIVGANGSGKSLITRMAAGLIRPASGRVAVLGARWTGQDEALRRRVGVVLQQGALLTDLTVAENVRFRLGHVLRSGERRAAIRVDRALSDFGMEYAGDQPVGALSLGERRRADLAQALVTDPDLLVLDDVFDGIDAASAADLEARILRLTARRRRTLLFLTHDRERAGRMAERIVGLENGKLAAPIAQQLEG